MSKHNGKRGKKLRIRLSYPSETAALVYLKQRQEKERRYKEDLQSGLELYQELNGGVHEQPDT